MFYGSFSAVGSAETTAHPTGAEGWRATGPRGAPSPPGAPDRVDEAIELRPEACPHCQTPLDPTMPDAAPLRRTQVWELPRIIPSITEYRQHTLCCPQCRELVTALLPPDAPPAHLAHGQPR